jgi:DNA-binding CsgD family transcriptional regulator
VAVAEPAIAPEPGLTAREHEILALVAKGLTDADIATRLFLSPHTVHRHLANVRSKLGLSSRAAVAAYAVRHVALLAATRGAQVTGVDLTPELFDLARARAADRELRVELLEGDAGSLPFADGSFDVVLSTFGLQYAPRREITAAELVRVCRPGGRIAVANWTPASAAGRYIDLINDSFGIPADSLSPTAWGDPEEVDRLFAAHSLSARTHVDRIRWEFASVDDCVRFFEENFGCAVTARSLFTPAHWTALRGDMGLLFSGLNRSENGLLVLEHEYLLALPSGSECSRYRV